jgi:hypothetical protein
MKLKNKVIGTIFGVVASSFVFISVPVAANAGECSAADPCQSWSMLDDANNVVNVIVCQPSVCGSGMINGQRVVLQSQANPQTNDTQGIKGYRSIPEQNISVTVSQNGNENTLVAKQDDKVLATIISEQVQNVEDSSTVTTTMAASFDSNNDLQSDGSYSERNSATVTGIQATTINGSTTVITDSLVLNERTTMANIVEIVERRNQPIFKSRLMMLQRLLGTWAL